jgi:hypothetical protein
MMEHSLRFQKSPFQNLLLFSNAQDALSKWKNSNINVILTMIIVVVALRKLL